MKLAKPEETESTIRFNAKLVEQKTAEATGSWTLLSLPKGASARLPSKGLMVVEGTINGFPFRAPLEPDGQGSHGIKVGQALQGAAGADAGDTVTVEITRIGEEPEVRAPTDLQKALSAAPSAQALWVKITPMARRDWILWVTSAKLPETRTRRIENACDMLASGKRRPCCFPGINWRTKDHVPSEETWVPLPGAKNHPSPRAQE